MRKQIWSLGTVPSPSFWAPPPVSQPGHFNLPHIRPQCLRQNLQGSGGGSAGNADNEAAASESDNPEQKPGDKSSEGSNNTTSAISGGNADNEAADSESGNPEQKPDDMYLEGSDNLTSPISGPSEKKESESKETQTDNTDEVSQPSQSYASPEEPNGMEEEIMQDEEQKRRKMEEEIAFLKDENKRLTREKKSGIFIWMTSMVAVTAVFVMLHFAVKGYEVNHHELRLMLVGKTGAGKSASGNTILGEAVFSVDASPASVTDRCETKNKVVGGWNITLIDTPGVMDTWLISDKAAHNAHECISMIVPGPHVFLLVVRLGRFTVEEMNAVKWIQENFGEEALKFTMIVFTGGDLLNGKPIEKFISNSYELQNLVDTCEGRYHVFNNHDRSNQTQVKELFKKINLILHENMGYIYTKEVYQKVQQNTIEEKKSKQDKLKEMAVKLRDEQNENIKCVAELEKAYSLIITLQVAAAATVALCVGLCCKKAK